jgi:predicted nuclease of predicted toxin-antitoxin system
MKLLLDQDVYAATARFLLALGHDVVPVAGIGLSRAQDQVILRIAQEQNRILVTRDRDFGNLVFVRELGAGVIYLHILPSTQNVVHAELQRVLTSHTETELIQAFVVVEPRGHRIRHLPRDTSSPASS